MNVLSFLRQRLIQVVPVLFGIVLVVFMIVRLIPGDPARIMLGIRATEERLAGLRAELGLDLPIWQQFGRFVGNIVQGDLGTSLFYRRAVLDVILERLPVTVALVGFAVLLSVAICLPLAIAGAMRQGSWIDQVVRGFSTLTLSAPSFWVGLNLLILFAVIYPFFPIAGFGHGFRDIMWHLTLPVDHDRAVAGADPDPHAARLAHRDPAGSARRVRADEGALGAEPGPPPRPAQRSAGDGHDPGRQHRLAHGRVGGDRDGLQPAGPRRADRQLHHRARLPDDPGHRAGLRRCWSSPSTS